MLSFFFYYFKEKIYFFIFNKVFYLSHKISSISIISFYIENKERKKELKSKIEKYIQEVIFKEKKAIRDDRKCSIFTYRLVIYWQAQKLLKENFQL